MSDDATNKMLQDRAKALAAMVENPRSMMAGLAYMMGELAGVGQKVKAAGVVTPLDRDQLRETARFMTDAILTVAGGMLGEDVALRLNIVFAGEGATYTDAVSGVFPSDKMKDQSPLMMPVGDAVRAQAKRSAKGGKQVADDDEAFVLGDL